MINKMVAPYEGTMIKGEGGERRREVQGAGSRISTVR